MLLISFVTLYYNYDLGTLACVLDGTGQNGSPNSVTQCDDDTIYIGFDSLFWGLDRIGNILALQRRRLLDK